MIPPIVWFRIAQLAVRGGKALFSDDEQIGNAELKRQIQTQKSATEAVERARNRSTKVVFWLVGFPCILLASFIAYRSFLPATNATGNQGSALFPGQKFTLAPKNTAELSDKQTTKQPAIPSVDTVIPISSWAQIPVLLGQYKRATDIRFCRTASRCEGAEDRFVNGPAYVIDQIPLPTYLIRPPIFLQQKYVDLGEDEKSVLEVFCQQGFAPLHRIVAVPPLRTKEVVLRLNAHTKDPHSLRG
jgi:hypothetical protein